MKKFVRSDIGAKAAWKGFSSQTTYIAFRLLSLSDKFELHPEEVEDLLITNESVPTELIQIKNLSNNLALSDLSPKDDDSFFRRCLSLKEANPNLLLKVISFGQIGKELLNFPNTESLDFARIENKLLETGYKKDDINWISSRLEIEQINEEILIEQIKQHFSEKIETMAAPDVILDILTQYVSDLSRYSRFTTKQKWEEKVQQIGSDLASLRGVAKEYGNSFIPMTEFKMLKTREQLAEEFLAGINTLPQHIRQNLDIERPYWINQIDNAFKKEQLVIVKGASGQGKSTLCYRYLQNYYSENDVLCIQSVSSETQAQDIVIALNGMAKNNPNLVAYFDVSPLDTGWNWICEKHHAYGSNFKLLISIREEDFRRSQFDVAKTPQKSIGLQLVKDEAELIFSLHSQIEFRSFDEAWRSFGEEGPMMEFVYLLNRSETLKQRLEFQVRKITEENTFTDDWLKALLIVSYAGRFGIDIDFQRLLNICPIQNASKVIYLFEKEYLVKVSSENKKVESLHVLRAEILSTILLDFLFVQEEEIVFDVLSATFSNALILLISYYYDNEVNDNFIERLGKLSFNSWAIYGSIIKSLLWLDMRTLYLNNKKVLKHLDEVTSGNFPDFLIGDQTGYYSHFDGRETRRLFHEVQPESAERMEKDLEKLPQKRMTYLLLDRFLELSIEHLPSVYLEEISEISSIGYSLFWLAKRDFFVNERQLSMPEKLPERPEMLDAFLNLAIGIQYQNWDEIYIYYYPCLKEMIKKKFSVIYFDDSGKEIDVIYLLNMYDSKIASGQYSNESIMALVRALRRLDITKIQYNARLIGGKIHTDIEIPEYIKTIESKNLPWLWITEMNGWFSKMHTYDLLPEKWEDVEKTTFAYFEKNTEIVILLEKLLDHFYKKGNLATYKIEGKAKQIDQLIDILNKNHLFYPKQSVDKFGINMSNVSLNPKEEERNNVNGSLLNHKDSNKEKGYKQLESELRQKLVTFYQSFPSLLQEKMIKASSLSHNARISYINLMDACEILPKVVKSFGQEFPLASKSLLSEKQIQDFRVLSSVWSYLFLNDLRKDRSILFSRKEYLKKYLQKIHGFWKGKVIGIEGVVACQKSGSNYQVTVDIVRNSNVLNDIFRLYTKEFPEIDIYTFENSLWTNEFDFLEIHQLFLGHKIPTIYKIPSDKFAFIDLDNIEKKLIAYVSSDNSEDTNELVKHFMSYHSNIGDLTYVYNHMMDVYDNLSEVAVQSAFDENIYSQWAFKINQMLSSVTTQISESVQIANCILEDTFGEDSDSKVVVELIKDKCIEIEQIVQEVLIKNNLLEYETIMSKVKGYLNELANQIQTFTVQNEFKYQIYFEENL